MWNKIYKNKGIPTFFSYNFFFKVSIPMNFFIKQFLQSNYFFTHSLLIEYYWKEFIEEKSLLQNVYKERKKEKIMRWRKIPKIIELEFFTREFLFHDFSRCLLLYSIFIIIMRYVRMCAIWKLLNYVIWCDSLKSLSVSWLLLCAPDNRREFLMRITFRGGIDLLLTLHYLSLW